MKNFKLIDITKFKKSAKPDQSKGFSYYSEGVYFYDKEDYEKALDRFLKAEKAGYISSDMFCNISWMYGNLENYKKAQSYANKAIKLDPDFGRPYILTGNVFYHSKNYKKALENFLLADEKGWTDVYTARRIAVIFMENNNFFKAREFAVKAFEMDVDDADSMVLLAHIYVQQEECEKALKYYLKAEKAGVSSSELFDMLVLIYGVFENWEKALEYSNKLIFLDKNNPLGYYRKGFVYSHMEDYDKSLDNLLKAESLGGCEDNIDLYYNLSFLYGELKKDLARGNEYIDKVLALAPKKTGFLHAKGWFCLELKDYRQALAYYKKAMRYKQEDDVLNDEFYAEFSQVYLELKRYKLALNMCSKGLEIYPESQELKEMLDRIKKIKSS